MRSHARSPPSSGPDRTFDPGTVPAVAVALSAAVVVGVVTAPLLGGSPASAYPAVAAAVLVALVVGNRPGRG